MMVPSTAVPAGDFFSAFPGSRRRAVARAPRRTSVFLTPVFPFEVVTSCVLLFSPEPGDLGSAIE